MAPAQQERTTGNKGRGGTSKASRIKDRPVRQETRNKSKVELDLEVKVHFYSKVKTDVSIGLIE
jgi:hypothetical protein